MGNETRMPDSPVPSAKGGNLQTATFGMGCFWSPEALFGHLPGVVRTRTGYAGGTLSDPSYRKMGDHSETVQIDFDPDEITFGEILEIFWSSHNPVNINDYKGRQYMSLLLYHDEGQHREIRHVIQKRAALGKGKPETEIAPYSRWYLAEERHQKYYLQRYPDAVDKLHVLYPSGNEWMNSALAARLNGLAKGYTNLERIIQEIQSGPFSHAHKETVIGLIRQIRW
ncbi:peptide-methionine (S)-S-oxide reductase MsrA [Paenibacillus lutrae]|uniref:Peptide methionine sulfoxide reductase MsrA n=1 Tax=Paenibacillus lutrae TaxID=2078573 RepID=A0A7X3K0P4_9BACL|nr:peptide-methionine (S)-S-oxide reductase MsrA [Paenibacillus lutrae]MVP01285.1 peptide-methionine (S)-S-oxide reductase MsrA [Paenibacillus lutrae]